MTAQQAFEEALALNPDHPPLRVFYAQFLLRRLDDGRRAEAVLNEAGDAARMTPEVTIELARAHLYQLDYDAAFATLNGLTVDEISSLKLKRKYFDLLCQSCTRGIDSGLERRDWKSVDLYVHRLAELLQRLPHDCIDAHLQDHLQSALSHVAQFQICAVEAHHKDAADQVAAHLREMLNLPESSGLGYQEDSGERLGGRIHSLFPERGFGFITGDTGQKFFFHKNNLVLKKDFTRIEVSDTVSFRLGHNNRGVCAEDVALLET